MKPFCIAIALLCLVVTGNAQEEFVLPQAKLLTHFSFSQLSGGIMIVRAQLDNYPDTLNFVFDTGSGGISLDSTTANYLKLTSVKSEKTIRGIAGIKTVDFTMDHVLKLPGLQTSHLDFHINDYELLTSVYGVRIDGIIGYSFFRRYIVKLDYDNLNIVVGNVDASAEHEVFEEMRKPGLFRILITRPHIIQNIYYCHRGGMILVNQYTQAVI